MLWTFVYVNALTSVASLYMYVKAFALCQQIQMSLIEVKWTIPQNHNFEKIISRVPAIEIYLPKSCSCCYLFIYYSFHQKLSCVLWWRTRGADGTTMCKDLKLRKVTRIDTWNVRTLLQFDTLDFLTREMDRCDVNILGIAELRWSGKGNFSTDDNTIYYSGNEKGGINGVAFITSSFISKHVLDYKPVCDRIISIRIQAQPINLSIIQVYAPTSTASDDDLEYFYNQLQNTLDGIPTRDFIMITGDFIAKVGEGVQHEDETRATGSHGLGSRNERGSILVAFCLTNRLTITNTIFQQHPRRKYAWVSPNGLVRNQQGRSQPLTSGWAR